MKDRPDRSETRFRSPVLARWRFREIEKKFGVNRLQLMKQMYVDEKKSANEIAEIIGLEIKAKITARTVGRWINQANIKVRDKSERFRNAIDRGRMNYDHQKKIHIFKRKVLQPHKRYEIMLRDGLRCLVCGVSSKDGLLEVDHIIPVCRGGKTVAENLQTLCWDCNTGKRIADKER